MAVAPQQTPAPAHGGRPRGLGVGCLCSPKAIATATAELPVGVKDRPGRDSGDTDAGRCPHPEVGPDAERTRDPSPYKVRRGLGGTRSFSTLPGARPVGLREWLQEDAGWAGRWTWHWMERESECSPRTRREERKAGQTAAGCSPAGRKPAHDTAPAHLGHVMPVPGPRHNRLAARACPGATAPPASRAACCPSRAHLLWASPSFQVRSVDAALLPDSIPSRATHPLTPARSTQPGPGESL